MLSSPKYSVASFMLFQAACVWKVEFFIDVVSLFTLLSLWCNEGRDYFRRLHQTSFSCSSRQIRKNSFHLVCIVICIVRPILKVLVGRSVTSATQKLFMSNFMWNKECLLMTRLVWHSFATEWRISFPVLHQAASWSRTGISRAIFHQYYFYAI